MKISMKKFLIMQMIVNTSLLITSQPNFFENWINEQTEMLQDKTVLLHVEDLSLERNYFESPQRAVTSMSSSSLGTCQKTFVMYSADMYKDSFDKLWERQEQESLKREELYKKQQIKQERYYEEPARKRRRIET